MPKTPQNLWNKQDHALRYPDLAAKNLKTKIQKKKKKKNTLNTKRNEKEDMNQRDYHLHDHISYNQGHETNDFSRFHERERGNKESAGTGGEEEEEKEGEAGRESRQGITNKIKIKIKW